MSDHNPTVTTPSFLTAPETAAVVRIDESTLYRHLRNGTFPGVKIGGRYVVPLAVLEHVIADVLRTGRCIDLKDWTERWRADQAAAVEKFAIEHVQFPGGAA